MDCLSRTYIGGRVTDAPKAVPDDYMTSRRSDLRGNRSPKRSKSSLVLLVFPRERGDVRFGALQTDLRHVLMHS